MGEYEVRFDSRIRSVLVVLFLVGILVPASVPHVAAASFDPWANGWQYRKQVTVDHSKVSAPLTNFPVLIDTTDSNLVSKAQSDGDDILFMDGVGSANKLDHEIESYASGTGHLVAWVRIPTLSSTADTVFYMYYGNPSAANQQNKVGVWDSRFVMVQHLSETSGTHYDSTSHHNDGAPAGGLSQGVAGRIGGADNFDGVDDRIDVAHDNSLNFGTGGFTISVWIKYTSCGDTDVTRKGNMNSSPQMSYKMEVSSNVISGTLEGSNPGGGGTVTDNTARGDNNWHNAVFMRNAGTISLYVDGALKASQGGANMDLTSTAAVAIGAKPPPISPGGDYFAGMIDEVRYSNVGLGPDWILTSYRSVTEQFVTYGAEQQNGATTYTVTFYSDPTSGTVSADGVSKSHGSTGTYSQNQRAHVIANPPTGYAFSSWGVSGVSVDSASNPDTYMTVSNNGALTAHFTQIEYTLTVNVVGSGSVTKNPDNPHYHYSDSVQLTANPAAQWSFSAWSGDISGNVNPRTIIINGTTTVTATFTQGSTYDFSFVWMTDTQNYAESYPSTFDSMTQWIANNKDGIGIRYVMHTGDVVNVAENDAQWQNAKHSMNILTSVGIPYGVLGGNHDGTDGFINYGKYFGAQNHYDLITSNGVNFVIVYLSYGINSSEIAWASNIFQTYHDRIGILAVHEYIGSGGGYSGDGSALSTGVVVPNSNVWLVVCGHLGGAQLNTKTVGSRTYYELLSNYQTLANGGNGYEKIFYFDIAHSNVHVKTYSPTLNQWGGTGYNYDEFNMTLPHQSPVIPTLTVTGAYHGARLNWSDVSALSYNIYYNPANNPDNATQYATGVANRTLDVRNLPSATWDKTCYYWVAPVGSGGEALKSSWGSGSDKVWVYKIEIISVTLDKAVPGNVKVSVQYRSRYLGSEGITVGVQIGEYLGPGTPGNIPNRQISISSNRPIVLLSFMSTGNLAFDSSSSEFASGKSYKAWVFLWNQLPSESGYWEAYAAKKELIPITIP